MAKRKKITPTAKRPISGTDIAEAVRASGINTPYWTRVVGNRLEIQPLGGQVIVFDAQPPLPPHAGHQSETLLTAGDLPLMKRDELRDLAKEMGIEGSASMRKQQLVDAVLKASK